MKLSELIYNLEAIQNALPENTDPEVRMATQPSYPMQYTIGDVMLAGDEGPHVYIFEGAHDGYLSAEAAQAVGWR